jgi:hypothetical protein
MFVWSGVAGAVVVAALVIAVMTSSGKKNSHMSGVLSPTTYAISATTAPPVSPTSAPTSAVPVPDVKAQLLSVSDLPAGWSVNGSPDGDSSVPKCFQSALSFSGIAEAAAAAKFQDGSDGIPLLEEGIAEIPGQAQHFMTAFNMLLGGCGRVSFKSGGDTFTGNTGGLSLPKLGDQSAAYQMNLSTTASGSPLALGLDFVAMRKGDEVAVLYYRDPGPPDVSQLQQFAQTAAAKLQGSTT